jgi:hypothetical protein
MTLLHRGMGPHLQQQHIARSRPKERTVVRVAGAVLADGIAAAPAVAPTVPSQSLSSSELSKVARALSQQQLLWHVRCDICHMCEHPVLTE